MLTKGSFNFWHVDDDDGGDDDDGVDDDDGDYYDGDGDYHDDGAPMKLLATCSKLCLC